MMRLVRMMTIDEKKIIKKNYWNAANEINKKK